MKKELTTGFIRVVGIKEDGTLHYLTDGIQKEHTLFIEASLHTARKLFPGYVTIKAQEVMHHSDAITKFILANC